MGFEPTISCVTGRRALQTAPRGRVVSGSGGIRTHSISGSKPKWSADCLPSQVAPDGVEPSFPGCRPSVVAVGPRGHEKLRGLESNQRPPVSETGVTTSSNYPGSFSYKGPMRPWLVRDELRGQESNLRTPHFKARRHYQQRLPRTGKREGRAGLEPAPRCLTGTRSAAELPTQIRRVPCGSRTRLAGLEARHLCRSAKGT